MKKLFLSVFSILMLTVLSFSGTIDVKSPKGFERWAKGRMYDIRWEGKGLSKPVAISLWKNNSYVGLIIKNRPASGSYKWKVGYYQGGSAEPGPGYQIKINEQDIAAFAAAGKSRKGFSIIKAVSMKNFMVQKTISYDKFKIKLEQWGQIYYNGTITFKATFIPIFSVESAKKVLKGKYISIFINGIFVGKTKTNYPHSFFKLPAFQAKKLNLLPGWNNSEGKVIVSRSRGSNSGVIKSRTKFKINKGFLKIEELTPNILAIYINYKGKIYKKMGSRQPCHNIGETFTFIARFTEKDTNIPLKNKTVFFRWKGSKAGRSKTNNKGIAKFIIRTYGNFIAKGELFQFHLGLMDLGIRKAGPNWFWARSYTGWNFYFPGNSSYHKVTDIKEVYRELKFCPTGKKYNESEHRCYD